MMRKALAVFFCLELIVLFSMSAKAGDELQQTLKASSFHLDVEQNKVSGKAYKTFIDEASKHKVFMFGENHATAEIALFADQVYKDISKASPRLLVTEVGPIAAEKMESLIRAGKYEEFMGQGLNLQTIPFFAFTEEVPVLKTACEQRINFDKCIVGVDQEFIASASIVTDYLERNWPNDISRESLDSFSNWSWLNPFLVGQGDGKAINQLADSLKQSAETKFHATAEQLALSYKIYKNQMGGDSKWSNEARETLMMDNFIEQLSAQNAPDLYFKFGAYHTMKGESVTVDKAFGARVDDWAKSKGWSTLNLFVDGYTGSSRDPLLGFEKDKSHFTNWSKSPFAEFIPKTGAVLFDLKKLRPFANSEAFTKRQKMVINNYDYFLMFSSVSAANFLDGTLITRTYLGLIAFIVILVLALLIYWLVKFIKKRRRAK